MVVSAPKNLEHIMTASSTWQHADPADYNLHVEILEAAWAELAERDSKTFLVLRNDHIVLSATARTGMPTNGTTPLRWPKP
jgi:hypothetical protein